MHPNHVQLRAHTAGVHATLDARFAEGLHGPGRYPAYLLGMHRTVAAFEAAVVPPAFAQAAGAPREALLAADLQALGLAALDAVRLEFVDAAEWLGGLYVIEGSALGAGVLLQRMRAQPALSHAPQAFLQAHARPGARWRDVLALLAARSHTDLPALCAGADRMFAVAEDSFARADRRPS